MSSTHLDLYQETYLYIIIIYKIQIHLRPVLLSKEHLSSCITLKKMNHEFYPFYYVSLIQVMHVWFRKKMRKQDKKVGNYLSFYSGDF